MLINHITNFVIAVTGLLTALTALFKVIQHGNRDRKIHEYEKKVHAAVAQDLTTVVATIPDVESCDLKTPKVVNGN